jgi:hypothetical protein
MPELSYSKHDKLSLQSLDREPEYSHQIDTYNLQRGSYYTCSLVPVNGVVEINERRSDADFVSFCRGKGRYVGIPNRGISIVISAEGKGHNTSVGQGSVDQEDPATPTDPCGGLPQPEVLYSRRWPSFWLSGVPFRYGYCGCSRSCPCHCCWCCWGGVFWLELPPRGWLGSRTCRTLLSFCQAVSCEGSVSMRVTIGATGRLLSFDRPGDGDSWIVSTWCFGPP